MDITIRVKNKYSDGHKSEREITFSYNEAEDGDPEDWKKRIEPYIGDSHGVHNGGKLKTSHSAEIIATDPHAPDLVGQKVKF